MKKEKLIKKIVVSVGGLKGLVLEGTVESVKENKIAINGFKDTVRHPIHVALEDKIGDLKFNVLDICGIIEDTTNKNVKMSRMANCEILAIEFELGDTPWFKIKASSRLFDEKFQTICTPKVDSEDGYEFFDTVIAIIKSILEEVDHYVNKTKVISDDELMESFVKHGKGKGIDKQMMEEMSAEEKSDWLHAELGKMGFLVNSVHLDDMKGEEEEIDLETSIDNGEINFEDTEDIMPPIVEEEFEPLEIPEPVLLKAKK